MLITVRAVAYYLSFWVFLLCIKVLSICGLSRKVNLSGYVLKEY